MAGNCLLVFEQDCPSKYYRVDHAADALARLGFAPIKFQLRYLDYVRNFEFLKQYQLILLHRIPMTPTLQRLFNAASVYGIPTVFDADDCIFDRSVYSSSAIFDRLSPLEARFHMKMADDSRKTLMRSQAVTVSTSALAEYADRYNHETIVIPNCISSDMIDRFKKESEKPVAQTESEFTEIGYLSGTSTHDRDLSQISEPLRIMLETRNLTRLTLAGPLKFDYRWKERFSSRIRHLDLVDFNRIAELYHNIHINLAPLEWQNPFCICKSEIKYLEAALAGTPTIASPIPAFSESITHGTNGFIAGTNAEWIEYLNELITDRDLRISIGQEALRSVTEKHSLDRAVVIWSVLMEKLGCSSENR